jgi:hypothetical protein
MLNFFFALPMRRVADELQADLQNLGCGDEDDGHAIATIIATVLHYAMLRLLVVVVPV